MSIATSHCRKQLLFALLSAADFALTWWLLTRPDGGAYEANPVAAWWLARAGWLGLALYKAGVVGVVVASTAAIARRRPQVAGRVLWLACACLAAVVTYSAALGGTAQGASDNDAAVTNVQLDEINRQTHERNRRREPGRALMRRLIGDVPAGRCTLCEGVEQMLACEGSDPERLRLLAIDYPDVSVEQRFACWICFRILSPLRTDPDALRRMAHWLEGEYQSDYGAGVPQSLIRQFGPLWPAGRLYDADEHAAHGLKRSVAKNVADARR